MKKTHWSLVVAALALAAGILLCPAAAYAQASLAGENMIDDIEVNGQLYTVVRDAVAEKQYYYIPNAPRLVTNKVGGKDMPKFSLVRYQYKDQGGQFREGGVLQFEVNMALPTNVLDKIKTAMATRLGVPAANILLTKPTDSDKDKIKLGCLPFSDAKVNVYSPIGELFTSATPTEGVAPNVGTGSIPFSFHLEGPAAADIMTSLTSEGQGGVPVFIYFEYTGVTPPIANIKATVDMKSLYDHFEKNEKTRVSVGCWFWKHSTTKDYKEIRETIQKTGSVNFSELQSDDPKAQETMDQFRDWVMEQVAKDLLVLDTPPPKIDPAQAADPDAKKHWWNVGASGNSVSIRKVKQEILVNKTYSMDIRRTVKRSSMAGALIGVGTFSKDVRDKVVFDVKEGVWDKVFYAMPNITADPSVGIQSASIEIALKVNNQLKKQEAARWTPDTGSWMFGTDYVSMMSWGLKGLIADSDKEKIKIHTKMTITAKAPNAQGPDTRIVETEIPAFDGKSFVALPTDTQWAYLVYPYGLSFNMMDPGSELQMVSVMLQLKDPSSPAAKTLRFNLAPNLNQPWVDHFGMLMPENATELKATVSFIRKGAAPVNWEHNGKNLLEMPEFANLLYLDDTMWKK